MEIPTLERHFGSLLGKREGLVSLWQEIADHFYPERADFTMDRHLGHDFASGLMTSYPMLVRRDLGNSFSAMLRPAGKPWFAMSLNREPGYEERIWLEWAATTMRRAMYDRVTQFIRATKEGDHDFATFGQAVIEIDLNTKRDALLYRAHHLRDVVWCEDANGHPATVYRKYKATLDVLQKKFPGKLPPSLTTLVTDDPYREVECAHAIMLAEDYNDNGFSRGLPYISTHWLRNEKHVLESTPVATKKYVIPRWQTVSGSQYAHSPATVCGLADARLIQAMSRVLLEAGEKATNPPLIAVQEAVRSDVQMLAGGITWVDAEYDERLGEVLRPLSIDKSGIPMGLEMWDRTAATLKDAFFLNQIQLPQKRGEMTAYEVSQYVSEYIRKSLPLFEPAEIEYNGGVCEETFHLMMVNGGFGPMDSVPRSLRGADIQFKFQSPIQNALDSEKSNILQQAGQVLAQVASYDPSATIILDAKKALREALYGIQTPATWLRSEQDVQNIIDAQTQEADKMKEVEAMETAAKAAKTMNEAQAIPAMRAPVSNISKTIQ